jgi:hypothetical protein
LALADSGVAPSRSSPSLIVRRSPSTISRMVKTVVPSERTDARILGEWGRGIAHRSFDYERDGLAEHTAHGQQADDRFVGPIGVADALRSQRFEGVCPEFCRNGPPD